MKKKRSAIMLMCLLVAAAAMLLVATGCGNTDRGAEEFGIDISMTEFPTTWEVMQVDLAANDLPEPFNTLKVGMTADEVESEYGYPATIQDTDVMTGDVDPVETKQTYPDEVRTLLNGGGVVYKYFIEDGKSRLYLVFEGGAQRPEDSVHLDMDGYTLSSAFKSTP